MTLLLLLAGCGQFIVGLDGSALGEVFVATLPEGAQVVDARTADEWAAGHVPGAAQVSWQQLHGLDDDGLWDVLPADEVAALLGDAGVDPERTVVLYGSGPEGYGDDGNLYWVLRWLGHDSVQVLDGGWSAWLAAGGEASTDDDRPASTTWSPTLDDSIYASTDDVAEWDGAILDVRSPEEWAEGHVPGAVWLEWTEVFDADATLLPRDDLLEVFADLGVVENTPTVTYCQGGIRAGHTFMVLEALGMAPVANYVGSWARWTAEGMPVEE